jgi:hypothetical protein
MGFAPLKIRPGVNQQYTPALNEGGYSSSAFARFKDGLAEKIGGWQRISSTALIGTARGSHVWSDLGGNPYLAEGTNQRLEVFAGGQILDVTPLRVTHDVAVALTTVLGSATVTVTDTGHGAEAGDWVDIFVPISVGGLIIQGFYLVQTVVDADNYTITAASNATAGVTGGGAVPLFTTTNGSPDIEVTLDDHGLIAGDLFTVQISTTVATVVILGTFVVTAPVTANTFFIAPGGNANADATGSENGGDAQYQYLIPSGSASATATSGYGAGDYGGGDYGGASPGSVLIPVRQWFLDNWGQDLIGNYTNGPSYYWAPPSEVPATLVPNGPTMMTASFVAMPQQIFVALGAETSGTQDPNLIRWTDASDFTVWTATALNQAGSFRLPTGSRIVGGVQAPQQGLIWTDVDLWAMQYVQPPLVFGFTKVASEVGLVAGHAAGVIGERVVWMGQRSFYILDGQGVRDLPCTVWDFIFKNLNAQQVDKIHAAVNSLFNEITFYFPSATGTGEIDSFVTYNTVDQAWCCGNLVRTTWVDQSALGPPIGVDGNALMQQHDLPGVYDNDGIALDSYWQSGYFLLDGGTDYIFLERMIPDFIWAPTPGIAPPANASALLTVVMTDYPAPNVPVQTFGPFTITPSTQYVIVRGRGRYVSLKVETSALGVFLRTGSILHNGAPAGKR